VTSGHDARGDREWSLTFDRDRSRHRNVVERGINRLTQWREIATRSNKRGTTYRAMVVIASLMIWLGS